MTNRMYKNGNQLTKTIKHKIMEGNVYIVKFKCLSIQTHFD